MEGDLSKNANLDDLTAYLMVGISGLRTMVKAGTEYNKLHRVAQILLTALK
ncbi:MAG: hypothetical protein ABGX71_09175 [Methyloprofundus sp.]